MLKLIRNPPPGFKGPAHKSVLKTVAQGDYVVVIWNQAQPSPRAPGQTYVGQSFDMFRIENGKVAEHWDDTRMSPRPWVT